MPPSLSPSRGGRPVVRLLLAAAVCAALCLAARLTRPLSPAYGGVAARSDGAFPADGQFVRETFADAEGVRVWGSWAGDDRHTGSLTLGPFAAPPTLRVGYSGYPLHAGNRAQVTLVATGEHVPLVFPNDAGEGWKLLDVSLPPAWLGRPITLEAHDAATDLGGWLALSEPLRGGRGTGVELLESLAAWSVNGLLLVLLWLAAARRLAVRSWIAPHWVPLAAAAVVALLGYAVLWIYFASALAGKIVAVALLPLAAADSLRQAPGERRWSRDLTLPATLLFLIGLFYVGLLHLFPSSLDFDTLAANRFREALPGDNTLPRNVAEALFQGVPLREPAPEWRSSDRPPLQSGWLLLTRPVTAALHLTERTANGTAGLWFQSLWVFGAYGLLRTLRLSRGRAAAWVPVLALSGFFLQNTVFAWPKLSAAAFACGAFALWILPPASPRLPRRPAILLGALLAGLAWLSHGGVAFSFLALVPWLLWRLRGDGWRPWALAALVFSLLAAPWAAYQKFYDPPGDRLLKMHLAGFDGRDDRSAWQTIRDAYRATPWAQIVAHRTANLRLQLGGGWHGLFDVSSVHAAQRRNDEFFLPPRALTWWLLGLPALPFAVLHRHRRGTLSSHAALAGWILLTVLVWCLLMFTGGAAVIHQGSYTVMLGAFVLLSVWCDSAGRWLLPLVAALQSVTFATTWARSNAAIHGAPNLLAAAPLLLAFGALILLSRQRLRPRARQSPPVPLPPRAPPAEAAPGKPWACGPLVSPPPS